MLTGTIFAGKWVLLLFFFQILFLVCQSNLHFACQVRFSKEVIVFVALKRSAKTATLFVNLPFFFNFNNWKSVKTSFYKFFCIVFLNLTELDLRLELWVIFENFFDIVWTVLFFKKMTHPILLKSSITLKDIYRVFFSSHKLSCPAYPSFKYDQCF